MCKSASWVLLWVSIITMILCRWQLIVPPWACLLEPHCSWTCLTNHVPPCRFQKVSALTTEAKSWWNQSAPPHPPDKQWWTWDLKHQKALKDMFCKSCQNAHINLLPIWIANTQCLQVAKQNRCFSAFMLKQYNNENHTCSVWHPRTSAESWHGPPPSNPSVCTCLHGTLAPAL